MLSIVLLAVLIYLVASVAPASTSSPELLWPAGRQSTSITDAPRSPAASTTHNLKRQLGPLDWPLNPWPMCHYGDKWLGRICQSTINIQRAFMYLVPLPEEINLRKWHDECETEEPDRADTHWSSSDGSEGHFWSYQASGSCPEHTICTPWSVRDDTPAYARIAARLEMANRLSDEGFIGEFIDNIDSDLWLDREDDHIRCIPYGDWYDMHDRLSRDRRQHQGSADIAVPKSASPETLRDVLYPIKARIEGKHTQVFGVLATYDGQGDNRRLHHPLPLTATVNGKPVCTPTNGLDLRRDRVIHNAAGNQPTAYACSSPHPVELDDDDTVVFHLDLSSIPQPPPKIALVYVIAGGKAQLP